MMCLASRSPRRAQLLRQIGVPFWVSAADIDETPRANESPAVYVERMAREKAQALLASTNEVVLGADTSVIIDGQILGKPVDEQHAMDMLKLLSGRSHQVISAVALAQRGPDGDRCETVVVMTDVQFAALSDAQIRNYIATGEPNDKAGAYGIQGLGAVLVESIQGSHSNVVGLPLYETAQLLERWQVPLWQPSASQETA
ncbi:hypothetical protein CHH28_08585 [Bacterioplanes sanyensis]|uniref:dTTP/UTP pyrophosphatase n=1 Tax=Bacterioplanes sanyensis TaxID=1249553 RepID=A0A222FKH1_9GAMM|nr:Maf family protein [Bacterioplanes sanyensis]ASP38733.1 hypothetical protein CHH28_08585 [Bacterioplanes sanyensis]